MALCDGCTESQHWRENGGLKGADLVGFESVAPVVLPSIGGLGTISMTSGATWEVQGEGFKTESEVGS